jgi:uncharacterized small protein (DUF1192 family)
MTAEEHLKLQIGELVIQLAMLKAERDRLQAELAARERAPAEERPA